MAEMNLLKASFTGKLGATTGAKWKNKNVIKSKIWSKAPPTESQTDNVRAFECLNRISSQIASLGFQYLQLSDKKMLKHNAVSQWLKPVIKNHSFQPQNIEEVIPADGTAKIKTMTYNRQTEVVNLITELSADYIPQQASKMFVLLFNHFGTTFFTDIDEPQSKTFTFHLPNESDMTYYGVIFIADPTQHGWEIHGFDIRSRWNMQYSLTEQDTGDLWINGKPIYVRTWTGVYPNRSGAEPFSYIIQLSTEIDEIIQSSGWSRAFTMSLYNATFPWTDMGGSVVSPGVGTLQGIGQIGKNNTGQTILSARIVDAGEFLDGAPYTVTLWYTKN